MPFGTGEGLPIKTLTFGIRLHHLGCPKTAALAAAAAVAAVTEVHSMPDGIAAGAAGRSLGSGERIVDSHTVLGLSFPSTTVVAAAAAAVVAAAGAAALRTLRRLNYWHTFS